MKHCKWIAAFLMIVTSVAALCLAACQPEDEPPVKRPDPRAEVGTYYYDALDREYLIYLDGIDSFTYFIGDSNGSGKYTVEADSLSFTTLDETKTFSATISGEAITVNYDGAEMRFYKQITYSVTFETGGGSSVSEKTVLNGRTLAKPADPVRGNDVFLGWYTDEDFKTPFLFDASPVTGDIKLYAHWAERVVGQDEFTVDFDLGYDGAESIASVQTIGGALHELPEPATRDGYTFGGWWISMTDEAEKVSFEYTLGTVLAENTTLHAAWTVEENGSKLATPVVTIENGAIKWSGIAGASNYRVEVDGPDGFVAINQTTGSTTVNIPFDASPVGTYVIRVTAIASNTDNNSDTAVRSYVNKGLARVSLFTVVEPSVLVFNKVEHAERYYITIECGNEAHNHTRFALGGSTTYNFTNCEMQEGGIRFTVTAEASGYASSVSRTFVYNRALAQVEEFVFDEETQTLTWDSVPDAASYVVSVSYGNGMFETIDLGNKTSFNLKKYAANKDGTVIVNVYPTTKGYNAPAAKEFVYQKKILATPSEIHLEGNMLSWNAIDDAKTYEVQIGTRTFTTDTNQFDLDSADAIVWTENNDYVLRIRALGTNESLWSDPVDVRYFAMYSTLTYESSMLSWRFVVGADSYEVRINGGEPIAVEGGDNFAEIVLTRPGVNKLEVRYLAGEDYSDWASLEVYAHTVTFDSRGGSAVARQYKAIGDKMTLDHPEKVGYDFADWYNTPDGPESNGARYTDETFNESGELVLYAYYTPKTYTLTFDFQGGTGASATQTVKYERDYELLIPKTDDATKSFGGWFSAINGTGTQYTDETGRSLKPWSLAEDETLYAFWRDEVLKYTLTSVRGYSGEVYGVSAGARISYVSEVTVPTTYRGVPVMVVESGAFKNCSKLTVINLPDTIRLVSSGKPFQGCSALEAVNVYATSDENGNANRLVRYWSSDGVLFDYGEIDEQPDNPAQRVSTLVFVPLAKTGAYRIPDGIKTIDFQAFASTIISEITIPTSVVSIGDQAFSGCKELAAVKFETGDNAPALTIGQRAFYNCDKLTTITLPARLTSIATEKYFYQTASGTPASQNVTYTVSNAGVYDAFAGCDGLEEIIVEDGSATYASQDGMLMTADKKTILYCLPKSEIANGNLTIPVGVETIADGAFLRCTNLQSVVFPYTVTKIGEVAFYSCITLEKIKFEGNRFEDVTLGKYSFRGCTKLNEIEFETGSRVTVLEEGSFFGCTSLTSFTIPASMEKIEDQAFRGCTKLAMVSFAPNGKDLSFGEDVFNGCTSLTTFYLPANVTTLPGVFGGCTALANVEVDPNNPNFTSIDGVLFNKTESELLYFPQGRDGTYTIPESVTTIANGVFRDNKSLTRITIPQNVTKIGVNAFYGCSELVSVEFVESPVQGRSAEDSLEIGAYAFYNCTKVKRITLPARTRVIGDYAFYYLTNLQTLNLNEGLVEIGASAIRSNSKLTSLYIPSTVKTLGLGAISYNSALTDVTFAPDSHLEVISDFAFYKTHLASITIPKTVKIIGTSAFEDTTEQSNGGESYTVPNGILAKVSFEAGSQLEEIGARAFYYSNLLEEITIPKSVKVIGPYAFYYCSALKTLEFEEGGTEPLTIGASAAYYTSLGLLTKTTASGYSFYSAKSLEEVHLPSRTVELGGGSYGGCFSWCDLLREVTFGENSQLQNIGQYTFYECKKLERISLPNTMRNLAPVGTVNRPAIGERAFYYCEALESVVLASGGDSDRVITIGDYAFYNCKKLSELVLPARMGEYTKSDGSTLAPFGGSSVFSGCESLTHIEIAAGGGGMYASNDGIVYSSDFKTVIYCPIVRSGEITILASATKIADKAFYGCTALTAINFEPGSELTEIGVSAFYNCRGITEMTLPSKVESIGANAFQNCVSLQEITLSSALTSTAFDSTVFTGCNSLENVYIEDGNTSLKSEGGVLFDAKGTMLIYYPATRTNASYTVPAGVTQIGVKAFYNNVYLRDVTLPSGLMTINNHAFDGCSALTRVNIPNTVTLIDDFAFNNCKALKTVEFEEGGRDELKIGTGKYATSTSYQYSDVFYHTDSLKELALPERLTSIANRAFGYSGIKSISLPSTLKTLGTNTNYAYIFSYCTSLETVTFAENNKVESLGNYTFQHCEALKSIMLPEGIKTLGNYVFQYCYALKDVALPESLTTIGTALFSNCTSLESLDLGKSNIQKLPTYTFQKCSSLKAITLPVGLTEILTATKTTAPFVGCTSLQTIDFEEGCGLTTIGNYAFYGLSNLVSITLPETVKKFGNYVFLDCSSLASFTFPADTTDMGTYTFQNCTSLADVDLTQAINLKSIGKYAFDGCVEITSIEIPSNITALGDYCFRGTSITSFTVPAQITTLPNGVFGNCDKLSSVTLHNQITALPTNAFLSCTALEEFVIPDTIKTIGNYAFRYCSSLKSLTFPNNTAFTAINANTFEGCTTLKSITIPSTVTTIGNNVFKASGLESIVFPDSVKSIGTNALQGCADLMSVKLPENSSFTTISNYMFDSCASLPGVTIPDSVTSIGTYVFNLCSSLESIVIPDSVKTIGIRAFGKCAVLKNVKLPDNSAFTAISNYTFESCTALESIVIPDTVKTIGTYAFQFSGIKEMDLPDSVVTVDNYAFNACEKLTKISMPSVEDIGQYAFAEDKLLQSVNMPEIVSIDKYAFLNCKALRKIELPDSLEQLESFSFSGAGLESITIPSAIRELSSGVFDGCESLLEVILPNTLEKIGDHAFRNCIKLSDVELPSGLLSFGANPFAGCKAISSFDLPATNSTFLVKDGILFDVEMTSLYGVPTGKSGAYTIPDGIIVMPYAFAGSTLSVVTVETGAVLNEYAFAESMIDKIVFNGTVSELPAHIFENAAGLREVVISGLTRIGEYAFSGCGIENWVIPNTVTEIGAYAFDGAMLKQIAFEEGGTEALILGTYAFANTEALQEITVSSRVRIPADSVYGATPAVGDYAFSKTGATSIVFAETPEVGGVEGVLFMGAYVFRYCPNLVSVEFPAAVGRTTGSATAIGTYAFADCPMLERVVFHDGGEGVYAMGTYTFQNCTSLKNFDIPSRWTTLTVSMFEGTGLEEITVPETITTAAASYPFRYCTNLKKVTFLNTFTSITTQAFNGCTSLETVEIVNAQITSIGGKAFLDCAMLKSLTIPESLKTINANAFEGCTSLKTITIPANVTTIAASAFAGWTADQTIILAGGEDQAGLSGFNVDWLKDCDAKIVYGTV